MNVFYLHKQKKPDFVLYVKVLCHRNFRKMITPPEFGSLCKVIQNSNYIALITEKLINVYE